MRLGFRRVGYGKKLGLSYVALVVAVGAVVLLLIDRALVSDLLRDVDTRLEAQARSASAWTTEGRHPARLATRLGGIVGAHVTILDHEGRVLGDSTATVALGADESRAPEVAVALTGGIGRASRPAPDGTDVRYVAIPGERGTVLRLGASLSALHATVARVRARLAVASLLGIALAIGLSYVASRIAARPLRAMRDAALRIADGEYDVSLPGVSNDELGELERTLSVLATRLATDRTRIGRLEATRRDFVANVSHELRTPTTALQGYAETLLRGGVDEETTVRFLETLHRQAQRIGVLVTDLLALSEAEAHVPGARAASPVPLGEVVKEAVLTVREGVAGSCEVAIDVEDTLRVSGDSGAVQQIVENLVSNAVRYGGAGGSVRAYGTSTGEHVRIVVEDTGPGISPEHLPRIFERFYRVDPARSRAEGGTGLGLAIVKHLAESMGGSVSAESELGHGTRFIVELPAARG